MEAITRDGLWLTERGRASCYRLDAVEKVEARPDLVLLAVKTPDLVAACQAIHPHLAGVPTVTLQNGLQADAMAASVLGPDVIVGAVVVCAATHLAPGKISVDVPGWLVVGAVGREREGRARQVARTLGTAMPTYLTGNLNGTRWAKLIANLNNGLSAATGLPLATLARDPSTRLLLVYVMREGHQVARAAGVQFDRHLYGLTARNPQLVPVALMQSLVSSHLPAMLPPAALGALLGMAARGPLGGLELRGSTWQSLVRGRLTEIDFLNGEIVLQGSMRGVPAPFNARIVELVYAVERTSRFCAPDDLWPESSHARAGMAV